MKGNKMEQSTTTTPAVEATPKAPSKKSLAVAIFAARLTERTQGLFATNKQFRAAVLGDIQTQLGVSVASAATMYNAAKKDVETAGTAILGRDPKIVRVKNTSGKRGRPQGSKNKAKTEVVSTEAIPAAEVAPAV